MANVETWITGLLALFAALQLVLLVLLIKMISHIRAASAPPPPLPDFRVIKASRPAPDEKAPDYGSVLRIEMGDQRGHCFKLKAGGSTWIGRDGSSNDIVIPCAAVSRRHCRVESDGLNFFVHDLGSTNGTFLNGQPVDTSALRHGDTLAIGSMVLRFLEGPEEGASVH